MWILLQFNYTLKALTGQPFWVTRSCFYLGLSATAPFLFHLLFGFKEIVHILAENA
jgi:hypothetical protein